MRSTVPATAAAASCSQLPCTMHRRPVTVNAPKSCYISSFNSVREIPTSERAFVYPLGHHRRRSTTAPCCCSTSNRSGHPSDRRTSRNIGNFPAGLRPGKQSLLGTSVRVSKRVDDYSGANLQLDSDEESGAGQDPNTSYQISPEVRLLFRFPSLRVFPGV